MAQNIMSAIYKGVGGWVDGIDGRLRLPFRHNGASCCPKGAVIGLQTTLQGKAGHPITVMDDWEQPHTNATLLKPTKHCYSFFRPLQGHEKVIWKSRPGSYCHSIVVSG